MPCGVSVAFKVFKGKEKFGSQLGQRVALARFYIFPQFMDGDENGANENVFSQC